MHTQLPCDVDIHPHGAYGQGSAWWLLCHIGGDTNSAQKTKAKARLVSALTGVFEAFCRGSRSREMICSANLVRGLKLISARASPQRICQLPKGLSRACKSPGHRSLKSLATPCAQLNPQNPKVLNSTALNPKARNARAQKPPLRKKGATSSERCLENAAPRIAV